MVYCQFCEYTYIQKTYNAADTVCTVFSMTQASYSAYLLS